MQVVDTEISKIVPYENNPRAHSEEQINRIASSIAEFGFNQPIVVDENNIVLVGHGRLEAAKKIGRTQVPTIRLSNLTEAQKKAYRIIDNKLQNDSTWQMEDLNLELSTLEELGFDLDLYGLDDLKIEVEPEVTEDDFEPSETIQTNIKLGDLIELGAHRVLCGDSTSAEDVFTAFAEKQYSLVLTDPPYNVAQDTKLFGQDVSKSLSDLASCDWDCNFVPEVFLNTIKKYLAPDSWLYVFTSHRLFGSIVDWMNRERGHANFCIWCKPNPMPSLAKNTWTFGAELCAFSKKGRPIFNYPSGEHCLNWWPLNKISDGSHPTQKPIKVMAHIIKYCSKESDMVLDPFLGSGTTLIACEQLGRICYGMEIEPKYCQVIVDRYRNYCLANNKEPVIKINGVLV